MPIYEYRCKNGHDFEVMQSMSDGPIAACEVCGAPVERVFHPVAVHFKGSGFYTTDYGRSGGGGSSDSSKDGSKSDSQSDSKSESQSDSKSESKSDSKDTASTKSESSSSGNSSDSA